MVLQMSIQQPDWYQEDDVESTLLYSNIHEAEILVFECSPSRRRPASLSGTSLIGRGARLSLIRWKEKADTLSCKVSGDVGNL